MAKKIVVLAPHPDDETLGCGGTLLKHRAMGDEIHWCIATSMNHSADYSEQQKQQRSQVIDDVSRLYPFDSVITLDFKPAELDTVPKKELLQALKAMLEQLRPHIIYLPYAFDVHSDHQMLFQAMISATKSFRAPYVEKILCYETLSETDFALSPLNIQFQPNMFVDISMFAEKKYRILDLYSDEFKAHPFPRSIEAVKALGTLRGAQARCIVAEAFILLKEIW
ncbi:MAG: PIG-L family deacetylase [Gammaproteobacteria bacterium]|nr:PIG-L family deacetylase [Gammaproteobacteria bacterium]MBU2058384.1 PIG-L family deacetylase [Gammaproteobacteria bacterium]MBU2176563.1 PIG-L family deacetylase [Gammaproteobacteria bacterium]MBU2248495.1 PIG-L family deacetylase [Gammaproteobacteria bacterium]MBU2345642.1 PIG-L family deacetylase [Gammaproteobacteria bacterium]